MKVGWEYRKLGGIRREYPITLGRIEGHGKRGKASDGRPCAGVPQHQTGGSINH